ncbi:unnamed protein product, partial [Prorocentrum cordatum]
MGGVAQAAGTPRPPRRGGRREGGAAVLAVGLLALALRAVGSPGFLARGAPRLAARWPLPFGPPPPAR